MKKRFLSILLTLCMVTQLVPTSALATQVTNSSGLSSADVYTVTDDSDLTVYDDSGQDGSVAPSDSDSSNDAVIETGDDSGEVALASATEGTHTHRVCGEKDCTDANHGGELTWTPISSLAQISADGNYYLTDDVTLSTDWYCANNVKLCLNGHNVTKQSNDAVINVLSGKSLAITDCTSNADEVGKITHASGKKGLGIYVLGTGTLDLWNGSITGNSSVWGAGVYNVPSL